MHALAFARIAPFALVVGGFTAGIGVPYAFGKQGELVLDLGESVPGAPDESIRALLDFAVASSGTWAARVQSDTADAARSHIVLKGGVELFRSQDTLPGIAPGAWTVGTPTGLRMTEGGRTLVAVGLTASGALRFPGLVLDGEVVFHGGDPLVGGGALRVHAIRDFDIDAKGRIVAVADFAPTGFGEGDLGLIEVDTGASPPVPRVLLAPGHVYPDGRVLGSVARVRVAPTGEVLTLVEDAAPGGAPSSALRVDDAEVLRTGDPAPVPGATWDLSTSFTTADRRAFDIAPGGAFAVFAGLVAPGAPPSFAIARNGDELIVRNGAPPVGASGPVIAQIDSMAFAILNDARVFWIGRDAASRRMAYIDSVPVSVEGDMAAGSTLETIWFQSGIEVEAIAPNGGFLVEFVELADGRAGLWRRALPIGEPLCGAPTPNSTGAGAELGLEGSDLAGGNALSLVASGMPPSAFGFMLASQATSMSTPAGAQGTMCVGGGGGTVGTLPMLSSPSGGLQLDFDTSVFPSPTPTPFSAGETWHFQLWYRDLNPAPTSNFSSAASLLLR